MSGGQDLLTDTEACCQQCSAVYNTYWCQEVLMSFLNLVDSQFCGRTMLMRFECLIKMIDMLFVCCFLRKL